MDHCPICNIRFDSQEGRYGWCSNCKESAMFDTSDEDAKKMIRALFTLHNYDWDEFNLTQVAEWASAVEFATEIFNHMDRGALANLMTSKLRDALIEARQFL